ncbi:MAG: hypothetical protein NUV80_05940 [Candidatus Berkelbacteria bacterium]|nr:hypothetical protein [Candidatus Berkelbacteria bacterium]
MTIKPPDLIIGRVAAAVDDVKLDLSKIKTIDPSGGAGIQEKVTSLIFAFLAAAAFIGIIYSGVMMITAGGDATKFAAGKKNLVWSIIGVIVVILAYFVIKFVYSLTGELIGVPTP